MVPGFVIGESSPLPSDTKSRFHHALAKAPVAGVEL